MSFESLDTVSVGVAFPNERTLVLVFGVIICGVCVFVCVYIMKNTTKNMRKKRTHIPKTMKFCEQYNNEVRLSTHSDQPNKFMVYRVPANTYRKQIRTALTKIIIASKA